MFFSLMIFVFSYGQYYKGTMMHLLFLQKYVGRFVCG